MFQYGYYSALSLTTVCIVLVFAFIIPLIVPIALFYFIFKYIADSYNLITVYKRDVQSKGQFLNDVIFYAFVGIVFFQLTQIAFFVNNQYYVESVTIAILMVGTIIFAKTLNNPSVNFVETFQEDSSVQTEEKGDYVQENKSLQNLGVISQAKNVKRVRSNLENIQNKNRLHKDALINWRKLYTHPLVLFPEIVTSFDVAVICQRVRTTIWMQEAPNFNLMRQYESSGSMNRISEVTSQQSETSNSQFSGSKYQSKQTSHQSQYSSKLSRLSHFSQQKGQIQQIQEQYTNSQKSHVLSPTNTVHSSSLSIRSGQIITQRTNEQS